MHYLAFQKVEFPPWTSGVFFLVAGIGLAVQTFFTYRAGFMYCGHSLRTGEFLRAYRKDSLMRYRVWFGIQLLGVATMFGLAALGFWTLRHEAT